MEYLNVRTMEKSKGLQPSDLMPQTARPQLIIQDQGYNMSQDNGISVPENVILQTTNYGMFKINPLNRAIRQEKLDGLYDSIRAGNLLHLFPIVVTRDFTVVDGQHRLKAAEALDVPIYYIVSGQMRIEDAARVNLNVSTWRGTDYLDHWCKLGIPDYILFRDFWAENQFLTFTQTLRMLSIGSGTYKNRHATESISEMFSSGSFKLTNLGFAATVTRMMQDFAHHVRFWKSSSFMSALISLAANPDYNHERMMQKMEYLSTRLVKCPDTKSYLQVIESIYNHKVTENNRVRFAESYSGRTKAANKTNEG